MNVHPTDGDKGSPTVDFHGEKRSNETHASTTDPESCLMRKDRGKRSQALLRGTCPDGEQEWSFG